MTLPMASARVALVTGGTRGIGAAIVRRLAGEGFAVFLSGRTEESVRSALDVEVYERHQLRHVAMRRYKPIVDITWMRGCVANSVEAG